MIVNTSVIVPTYNGEHKIGKTLKSVQDQVLPPSEVIVVIDGSHDSTASFLRNNKWNIPKLKIIEQTNKGRSNARNTGVKNSSGQILIFLDDDVTLEKEGIKKHLEHHEKYQNSILTGKIIEDFGNNPTDIQLYKKEKNFTWYKNLPEYPCPLNEQNLFVSAANLSLSKTTFEVLGGFDETLLDAEDYELGKKGLKSDIQVFYNPSIFVKHTVSITAMYLAKRWRQYAEAHKKTKKSNQKLNWTKWLVYYLFSWKLCLVIIDKFNVFKLFPRAFRYKIFDIVLTGLAVHFPNRKI